MSLIPMKHVYTKVFYTVTIVNKLLLNTCVDIILCVQ